MSVSIILVNYNGCEFTRDALRSIAMHSPQSQVIVIDNHSMDKSKELLPSEFPSVKFLFLDENRGFGAANNAGAAIAEGEHLFFLNNDTKLLSDTPAKLAEIFLSGKNIGICGPKLLNEDSTFQLSFGNDPSILGEWKTRRVERNIQQGNKESLEYFEQTYSAQTNVDWVTGAALMIPKNLFHRIGGFDERYFMYFEDADLCHRVRKEGYKVCYVPTAALIHYGGKSYSKGNEKIITEYRVSQLHFYKKHRGKLQQLSLRLYLFLKFFTLFVISFNQSVQQRSLYKKLIGIVLSAI
ncbi:MAG: glycosyltransferase family 2 protein [Ignavibacteriales bacterium]|nr:glycosyltransferase family 2 protein [Ignavibacteriales bacterium]